MKGFKKSLFALGLAGILFSTCSKDEGIIPYEEPEPEPVKTEKVYENVENLSNSELNQIDSIDSNSITFYDAMNFSKGDVLIGGVSEKTQGGLLRKVSSISNGGKTLNTTPASLEEVLQKDNFSLKYRLTMNDLEGQSSLKSAKNSLYSFEYEIPRTVVYDLDKNLETTNDQVWVQGNLLFDIDYNIYGEFDHGFKKFEFEAIIKENSFLEVGGNLNKNIEKEVNLYEQTFVPITIPGPAVPIVLRPKIEIDAGIIGEINGSFYSNISQEQIVKQTLIYENKKWSTIKELDKDFNFSGVDAHLDSEVKAYISPRMNVIVNELVGPYVDVEGYLKLHVNTDENPWWNLKGGINGDLGVDMRFLSFLIPDYEKRIIEYEELIAEAKDNEEENHGPLAQFDITPGSGTTKTEFAFDASKSQDVEDSIYDLYYRWDFEGDGIWDATWTKGNLFEKHVYTNSGTYYPKLEVRDSGEKTFAVSRSLNVSPDETPKEDIEYSKFIDPVDGQEYDIIRIKDQWWFQENFNRYTKESHYPKDDSLNNHSYGRMYVWEDIANNVPAGWRIPSLYEWYEMMNYFDNTVTTNKYISGNEIGNILKEEGTLHWKAGNQGRDEVDFRILGAGYNSANVARGDYLKERAYFWTRTKKDSNENMAVGFEYNSPNVSCFGGYLNSGQSVRFVKDD